MATAIKYIPDRKLPCINVANPLQALKMSKKPQHFKGAEFERCTSGKINHLDASLAAQRKWREAATLTGPFVIWAKAAQEEDRESWIRSPNPFHMGIQTPRNKAWQWTFPAKSSPLPAQVLTCTVTAFGTNDVQRRGSILFPPYHFHTLTTEETIQEGIQKICWNFNEEIWVREHM